ncbi:uncharacterized protein BKA78DRAFT_347712, partial [Phyllosticta capitalensis]|uniref:uncharacterized protein n=1 Tax=Phyllosticta capitalensis TaxID=121624 RepID=UPI0031310603
MTGQSLRPILCLSPILRIPVSRGCPPSRVREALPVAMTAKKNLPHNRSKRVGKLQRRFNRSTGASSLRWQLRRASPTTAAWGSIGGRMTEERRANEISALLKKNRTRSDESATNTA